MHWPPPPESTVYIVTTGKTLDEDDPDYEPLKAGDPVTVYPVTVGEMSPPTYLESEDDEEDWD